MAAESNIRLRVDGRDAVQQLNRVNKAAGTLQGTVTKLAGAFSVIQAARFVFFKTAELEKQTKSLQVLTGSLGNARNIIKELQDFGSVTPFTSAELIETAKRLKAFGVETNKLVNTTKRLGDIAGATGADLSGIATAYGQIQAKGRLQTEELLQLQERGVDLAGVLKKEYGLTGEEFSKALQKGQISAEAAEFALKKLTETGGQYAGGAIAQSDTLSGKMSTLQDNIDNLARVLGSVLSPAIKVILDQSIGAINSVNMLLAAGARAQSFGMTGKQRTKILRQAEEEAKELALIRGGGRLDPAVFNQLKQQREKDLIEAYGFKQGLISPEIVAPELAALPELGGSKGKGKGSSRTSQLRQQKDISEAMFAIQMKMQQARLSGDVYEQNRLEREKETQRILESGMMTRERTVALLRNEIDGTLELASIFKDNFKEASEINAQITAQAIEGVKAGFIAAQHVDAKLQEQAEKMNQLYSSIGQTITTGIVDSLTAAVDGTKSLAEVASNTLRSLANIMLKFGLQTFLGGLGGGNSGSIFTKLFGGGRASGGSVSSSKSYLVGERGPELFSPGRSGSIAPNGAMGGVNVGTINITVENTGEQLNPAAQKQLAGQVQGIVLSTLANERRSGGML